ncbi:60S ribosomal protein L6 [Tieghemiomyces parasiticus]|uniref:60S ribosomal protein L6 n=1 Tax=Tieghemiomyces parasiticus TaxID=78921 RepID=A0A9W8E2E2_9FUNG|nr:60S ribosomal protein L6 [Tieghemiomyces parasiticus]
MAAHRFNSFLANATPQLDANGFYPAEDVRAKKAVFRTSRPSKVRSSITPGTVLILLAGRFRGKRVVFLKRLESGLLLVSGPFAANGVPIKRVDQVYVVATSTKLDLSNAQLPAELTDDLFKREQKTRTQLGEARFFGDKAAKTDAVPEARIQLQKNVDSILLEQINKTPMLKEYLGSRFTLKKGQAPHLMKF